MAGGYLVIDNVWRSFDSEPVLAGVTIQIEKGESVAIIGQSGSGKSVLLKHIMKLMEPDKGAVLFDGIDLATLRYSELVKIRRRIGMLFQGAALFDSLSVVENVGLGLKESRNLSEKDIERTVMEKLELVGLSDAAGKYPAELSGGMKKRVGLARAIADSPELVLYDEPTTGLDPITADVIDNLILDLNNRLNVTSIVVTHDMKSAFKIAGRIIMLYNGRVEFDGTPDEVKGSSNQVVRQFITGSAEGPITVG